MMMWVYIYIQYIFIHVLLFSGTFLSWHCSFVENGAAARPLSMAAFVSVVQPQVRMNSRGRWSPSQVVICCRIKPPTSRVLKDGWLIRSEFDPFSFFRVLQQASMQVLIWRVFGMRAEPLKKFWMCCLDALSSSMALFDRLLVLPHMRASVKWKDAIHWIRIWVRWKKNRSKYI